MEPIKAEDLTDEQKKHFHDLAMENPANIFFKLDPTTGEYHKTSLFDIHIGDIIKTNNNDEPLRSTSEAFVNEDGRPEMSFYPVLKGDKQNESADYESN